MDIQLVGQIDGIDAAKVITDKMHIPIIFITGFNETKIYERAQNLKPIAYLQKPFDIWQITDIIESLFK